jgi:hypothetical protein
MFLSLCGVPAANAEPPTPGHLRVPEDSTRLEADYPGDAPADPGEFFLSGPSYQELDAARYGAIGKYLIHDSEITLTSGDEYKLLLVCNSVDKSGACLGIQIVVADGRKTPAAIIQRIKPGDGYVPEITSPPGDDSLVMFRVIAAGDNTEGRVYRINPVTGRLDETLVINRSFPERTRISVSGVMKAGGVIEFESKPVAGSGTMDMSESLDALIEDGLYQPDGNPVPALANLKLVRGGWEDEAMYGSEAGTRIEVGMSLVSLSKKPVVDVTATLSADESGNWVVTGLRFEPSLPYRFE